MRYPRAAAGLDHIATVLSDISACIDAGKLAALGKFFERTVLQRLGYMLSRSGDDELVNGLHEHITSRSPLPWVELEPALASDPDFAPAPIERDVHWHVVVRREPQADD